MLMLVFIYPSFLVAFLLGLYRIKSPRRAFFKWGVMGATTFGILAWLSSFGAEGMGSALAILALVLSVAIFIPFIFCGAAFGLSCAALVLWIGQGRAPWVRWGIGATLLGGISAVTVLPALMAEIDARQFRYALTERRAAIERADFEGTMAGHPVVFPASPRLEVYDECRLGFVDSEYGCATYFRLGGPRSVRRDEVLLHEREDPLIFRTIRVNRGWTHRPSSAWCEQVRPDLVDSIWCREALQIRLQFYVEGTVQAGIRTPEREQPHLSDRFVDTPLGAGKATCYHNPNPNEQDSQGYSCALTFEVAEGVKARLGYLRRDQLQSEDPDVTAAIEAIPRYWTALTLRP